MSDLLLMRKKMVVFDGFNRADNASSLGNADTGQAWIQETADWGISNGKAFCGNAGSSNAVVETGNCNAIVRALITCHTSNGLVFRYSDTNNYIRVVLGSTKVIFQKVVSGSATTLSEYSVTNYGGESYEIIVNFKGDSITIYREGVIILTATDSFNSAMTKHGLRVYNAFQAKFDNFSVEAI